MPYNSQGQQPNFTNTARQGLSGLGVEAPGNIPGGAQAQIGQPAEQAYGNANDYAQFQGGGNQGMNQEQYLNPNRPMGPNPMASPAQRPMMPPQATNRDQYLNREPTRDRFMGYGRDERRRRMAMQQQRQLQMQQGGRYNNQFQPQQRQQQPQQRQQLPMQRQAQQFFPQAQGRFQF